MLHGLHDIILFYIAMIIIYILFYLVFKFFHHLQGICLIMIVLIRDVNCCVHTKSLLTQQ